MLTKPIIVNWALAELGLPPKFSIDDQTPLGGYVGIFWPRTEARCFGVHDWTFCRRTARLDRLEAKPDNGWAYGFILPGDRIGPPLKALSDPRRETPLRSSDIEGDVLYADEPQVWARCKVAVDPVAWPVQFAEVFATALAAALAVPLRQDDAAASELEMKAFGHPREQGAGGIIGRLIAQDVASKQVSSPLLREDPLTMAHG